MQLSLRRQRSAVIRNSTAGTGSESCRANTASPIPEYVSCVAPVINMY